MSTAHGFASILRFTEQQELLTQMQEQLRPLVLSKTLCEFEQREVLSKQHESIGDILTILDIQAGEFAGVDEIAQAFLVQNRDSIRASWDAVRDLLGRVNTAPPDEAAAEAQAAAAKQLERAEPPFDRAQKLFRDVSILKVNINKGLIDKTEMLNIDDETTLVDHYRELSNEIILAAAKTRDSRVVKIIKEAVEPILGEIQKWYNLNKPGSSEKDKVDASGKEKKMKENKDKDVEATLPSKMKSLVPNPLTILFNIQRSLLSDDVENAMLNIATLSSIKSDIEKRIYFHFYEIHRSRKQIKKKHEKYGRLVFHGKTELCKTPETLKNDRLLALQRTIDEFSHKQKSEALSKPKAVNKKIKTHKKTG